MVYLANADICARARSYSPVAVETANLQFDDTTKGRNARVVRTPKLPDTGYPIPV